MWLDRFTGEQLAELPDQIVPGRYWAESTGFAFSRHTANFSGVLVDDGSQRCQLDARVHSFLFPRKEEIVDIELLLKAIKTIDVDIRQGRAEQVSPLMPAAVLDEQGHLQAFEKELCDVVNAGHLHMISQQPRLDMHYEDQVTDIARARRLSKGALVHLASHSECWQRQTLNGVVPRKVMARFSQDDYGIYENRVYARLLDNVERYLSTRLSRLNSLHRTLEQAMEFYKSPDLNYRLARAVCDLWGLTFEQEATSNATALLSKTLQTLERLHKTIRALQRSGLYTLIDRNAQVGGGLHRTNILTHDPHYRHVATLWELLGRTRTGAGESAEERLKQNQYLAQAYSNYAGLVLRRALQPYLGGSDKGIWAGRLVQLRQRQLEWELICSDTGLGDDTVLLTVVPWLTPQKRFELSLPANRFIAWPASGDDMADSACIGPWIPLSPSDMYCEERFGLLVDQALQRLLLEHYCRPLTKVPATVLSTHQTSTALHVDRATRSMQVRQLLDAQLVVEISAQLQASNATALSAALVARNDEILALEKCPVCSDKVTLTFQNESGFKANCSTCKTHRYLRSQHGVREYTQAVEGSGDFRTLGRRGWALTIEY